MNRNMAAKCNLAVHLGEQNGFVTSADIRFSDSILNNVYTNPGLGSQLQIVSPGQIKSIYPRISPFMNRLRERVPVRLLH